MEKRRIFVSSVQGEFAKERAALRDHVKSTRSLSRLFDVFLFEDSVASDKSPQSHFLEAVDESFIYVGLFGREYGVADETGMSPTEQEFQRATKKRKHRLVFLKRMKPDEREPRMRALIDGVQTQLIRKVFDSTESLVNEFDEALGEYLGMKLTRLDAFDELPCDRATMEDVDPEKARRYIRNAVAERGSSLSVDTPPADLLTHLGLLKDGHPTNAAILLFGRNPQKFIIRSTVNCVHTLTPEKFKPLFSNQFYEGTVFELLQQAVMFVLGGLIRSVGTRTEGLQAPITHEIPPDVVKEAIANALAHRDYTEHGNIQVTIYPDRLEVWNPGELHPALTLDELRGPHESISRNASLVDALRKTSFVEGSGTGTIDMIRWCAEAKLPEPKFESSGGFTVTIWREQTRECAVTVSRDGELQEDADVLVLSSNGETVRSSTNSAGKVTFETRTAHLPRTVFVSGNGCTAHLEREWVPAKYNLSVNSHLLPNGGSAIFSHGFGVLPGLPGRLHISCNNNGSGVCFRTNVPAGTVGAQEKPFFHGEWFRLSISPSLDLRVRVVASDGNSILLEFQAENSATSSSSSFEQRVLLVLINGPLSRSEIATSLGLSGRTGQLSIALRSLLDDNLVEFTIPGKPRSPLQRYGLSSRGAQAVGELTKP